MFPWFRSLGPAAVPPDAMASHAAPPLTLNTQPTMFRAPIVFAVSLALALACQACGGGHSSEVGSADAQLGGEPAEAVAPAPSQTLDFIATELNFYFPEGLVSADEAVPNPCGTASPTNNTTYRPLGLAGLAVNGFDLDGVDSQGDGVCPHTDYVSADGEPGIDFAFLHVIDMVRPARPGQTIQVVLEAAPSQGLVKVGIRISGVDDFDNDDEVEVFVTTTRDTPLLGTDGKIIAGSSVASDDDPAFQSRFKGSIKDGVLVAGPGDIAVGKVNLLVVEDRVITLKDAMIRATVTERSDGALEVDSVLGGWWRREDMVDAIGQAVLAIGGNPGELDCVLDSHMDHAMDGTTCDAMSMIFRVKAISGFITGLDTPAEGE